MVTALPLFVYGTLMHDQPAFGLFAAAGTHHLRAQLPHASLYTVGRYPIASAGDGLIHGEVHWLLSDNQAALLEQLDLYEGDEYTRVRRRVILESGEEVEAWVYLGDPVYAAQYQPIPSGDWRKRANECC